SGSGLGHVYKRQLNDRMTVINYRHPPTHSARPTTPRPPGPILLSELPDRVMQSCIMHYA
ncbi:MAG: hypothetical protein K2K92_07110, partial [Duncaniella sp.]|nr:hypothetical protein [Duncaniella sp.]